MKILIKSLFLLIFFFNITYSTEKIVFVDIDQIIHGSEIGKKLNKKMQEKLKNVDESLKKKEKALKLKENKILNQKNILSEDELNKQLKSLRKDLTNFRKERQSITKELRDQNLKETNFLVSNLNNILSVYAQEKSISLIIQKKNIVIGKSELDITKEILAIFNSKVKSITN